MSAYDAGCALGRYNLDGAAIRVAKGEGTVSVTERASLTEGAPLPMWDLTIETPQSPQFTIALDEPGAKAIAAWASS